MAKGAFSVDRYNHFQKNLSRGLPNDWHCGAGSRYLYVCEDGLVHWCSQQRGYPGIPLEHYTQEHLDREYRSTKPCAPYCAIGCVHRVAMLDHLRQSPRAALAEWLGPERPPVQVRILSWLFLGPGHGWRRQIFTRLIR